MMKVIGGDFKVGVPVMLKKGLGGGAKGLWISGGFLGVPATISKSKIVKAELVDTSNERSVGGAIGWGVAGAAVGGPLLAAAGAIIGSGKSESVVYVETERGKKILLTGPTKEVMQVVAMGI